MAGDRSRVTAKVRSVASAFIPDFPITYQLPTIRFSDPPAFVTAEARPEVGFHRSLSSVEAKTAHAEVRPPPITAPSAFCHLSSVICS